MIPVTVLTGFLGSGKTTLLGHLLRHPDLARTAVIINEFGAVALDHDLVEASDESFVELKTGCICCAVRGDLVATLGDLARRRDAGTVPPFERVVIETTGLADPAPVLIALLGDDGLGERFTIAGVVTTVDAVGGMQALDEHDQAVKQAALADRIVLTKTDLLGAARDETAALRSRLADLNPAAHVITASFGDVAPDLLLRGPGGAPRTADDILRWLGAHALRTNALDLGHRQARARHDDRIGVHTIVREAPIAALALTLFLEALMEQAGRDVLRLKGLVRLAEDDSRPVVVHAVQHLLHPLATLDRWPSADRQSRLVFILRDIAPAWIDALLAVIEAEVAETADRPRAM